MWPPDMVKMCLMPSCFSILATIWPLEIISGVAAVFVSTAVSTAVSIYLLCEILGLRNYPLYNITLRQPDHASGRRVQVNIVVARASGETGHCTHGSEQRVKESGAYAGADIAHRNH